ncbi:DUF3078 domain-containing protein [Alistipes senegalensis]|uniref:DUF3078 domain-containing protein n=1 Tax=Alistipes senegalensis TaxID=1288121 RepID=UPI00242F3A1C|nr:DUF3078 domain-containing protein [Alistipes senegalensis]MCI7308495.1 DUF3078 domain-containing protein [Alistipes senegalensis]MDD7039634.1 DUF3078 domain-containing protein [Alistipes senegalensis]MDY2877510.1 DUF3078 domain-containing protein [Alistipes senegalensis]
MKHLFPIFALAAYLLASVPASAQISIDEVNAEQQSVTFQDKLKSTPVDVDYFSLARYKAERAAIRKERNYLEFGGGLQGALTSYNDPWIATSGGDNSIALVATFNLKHIFTKDLFTIETKFNAKLGYNRMKVTVDDKEEGIWFKNQDEFEISTAPSFKMTKNWSYGVIAKFRSQFVNGYKSRTEQEEKDLKSKFMTPAYLDISLGITYKSPKEKFPITVNMSPLALNATFAESDLIRKDNGFAYGIEDPDKTSKYEGGSSVQIDFDRTFGKTGYLRYRTMLYGFYGWISDIGQRNKISDYSKYLEAFKKWNAGDKNIKDKPRLPIHPIVRWTNTIDIKATKFLSTTLSFELYYNRAQNVDVQTKTLLSVGLTYTFKNK